MNRRAIVAVARHELRRGRNAMRWLGGISLTAIVLTLLLPPDGAVLVGMLSLPVAIALAFGPIGSLALDKMHGHLEFDRTLPLPLRAMATGRLLGATLRSAPMMLGMVALGIAIARQTDAPVLVAAPLILLGAVAAQLLWWCFLWLMLGLNARFSLRRLWWLPMTIWLLPALLPDSVADAIGTAVADAAAQAMTWMDAPWQTALLLLAAFALPIVGAFVGGVTLFASGLARFRPDPTAFGMKLGAAPKRELAALGRGPLLAVARLRLRLALEQFRREAIIAVVLVALVVADVGELSNFARGYLPILAAFIPGGVALQLLTARGTGALEGLQHLPHSRRLVAAGHLVAVMVLAVPGAALQALSRAANGLAVTPISAGMGWLWYLAMGGLGAAVAVWGTRRRLIGVTLGIGALIGVAWLLAPAGGLDIVDLLARWRAFRAEAGLRLPLGAALVALVVGTELFAKGLATYDGRTP